MSVKDVSPELERCFAEEFGANLVECDSEQTRAYIPQHIIGDYLEQKRIRIFLFLVVIFLIYLVF